MQPKSFAKRTGVPVAVVLLVLALTTFLIADGWRFGLSETWDRSYTVSTVLRIAVMLYAVYLIYPIAFWGGAGRKERVLASFTPHFVWTINEFVELVSVYSVGEALYFILNPGFLFFVVRTFFQIGLCDVVCRWILRKRWDTGHSLSNRQAGALLVGSPVLQGGMLVFFLSLIDIYWMIHQGVFQ
ncbi:MAG: hypothetical protein GY859_02210 [Desulfobacterales bacterium]|nr:hypothetical protein [Desulfobacterales bacterium]